MALTTYDYDLDAVDEAKLTREILASGITNVASELELVENTGEVSPGLNIHVTFLNALSAGDKTILDGVIAAHPQADPEPGPGDSVFIGPSGVIEEQDLPIASETLKGIIEIATQAEVDAGTDDTRAVTPLKLTNWSGEQGQELYDAIVAPTGGDYTLPSAAFTAGHKRVWVRSGTYVETADIVIPNGGCLHGEGSVVLVMGSFQVKADGQARKTTAGTVAVSNGSTTVTGTGTSFTTLLAGDFISIGSDYYEIASTPGSNTSLTLVHPWRGPAASGLTYQAQQMFRGISLHNVAITGSTHIDGGLFIRGVLDSTFTKFSCFSNSLNINLVDSGNMGLIQFSSRDSGGDGIKFSGCRALGIADAHFYNNAGNGANVTGVGGGIALHFDNCEFTGNQLAGITVQGSATDVTLENCGSKRNNGKGINTEPGTIRCIIDGCTIQNNGSVGVDVDGTENILSNTQIGNNGSSGIFGGTRCLITGNFVFSNSGTGVDLNGDTDTVVAGNTVCLNGSHGINFSGTTNDCIVSANRVINNTGNGINIPATGTSRTRLSGNVVTGHGTNYAVAAGAGGDTTIFSSEYVGPGTNGTVKHNATTSDPTVSNDNTQGYRPGSIWVNKTSARAFICITNATGAANWKRIDSVASSQPAVQARRTTAYALTTAFADVNFDVTDVENNASILDHDSVTNTDRILIGETGPYRISYHVDLPQAAVGSTQDVLGRVRRNDTTVIPGSEARTTVFEDASIAGNNMGNNLGKSFVAQLTAGDFLSLQLQRIEVGGSGAFSTRSGAIFTATRLSGEKGDTGATGSGSNINVKDEGSLVAGGPHSTLNFVGSSVTVTNAGGGEATVTLGPATLTTSQVAHGTGTITETSLTDVPIPSLTLTPGAGTYLVLFSMSVSHNKSGQQTITSIYANGSQVPGTQRIIGGQSGNLGNGAAMVVVTVGAGQAIEARWRVTSNSGGGEGSSPGSRALVLVKVG